MKSLPIFALIVSLLPMSVLAAAPSQDEDVIRLLVSSSDHMTRYENDLATDSSMLKRLVEMANATDDLERAEKLHTRYESLRATVLHRRKILGRVSQHLEAIKDIERIRKSCQSLVDRLAEHVEELDSSIKEHGNTISHRPRYELVQAINRSIESQIAMHSSLEQILITRASKLAWNNVTLRLKELRDIDRAALMSQANKAYQSLPSNSQPKSH